MEPEAESTVYAADELCRASVYAVAATLGLNAELRAKEMQTKRPRGNREAAAIV
jgi:hypothetical protein